MIYASANMLLVLVAVGILVYYVRQERRAYHRSESAYYSARGRLVSASHARRAAIIAEAEDRHEGYLTRSAFRRACSKTTIYARDNGICGICERPVAWFDSQVDHIIPLARGGAHDPRNLQIAHASCNFAKGAKRR